jgi:CRP-like cAMP-binding protein
MKGIIMSVARMLTAHELFRSFPPEQVAAISRFASARKLEKGDVIYGPERKATHVFVLLEGGVELRLPPGAGETGFLVSRVGKGEFFGIAPFLNSDRYTTSAVCTRSSRVLFIEAKPMVEMLNKNPVIGLRIMSVVAGAYFERYQNLIIRIQKALADLAAPE